MVSLIQDIDTNHYDMIHDAQMNHHGTLLATCSSDKSVKVFRVHDGKHEYITTLNGHDGPVWQVAWAHPSFGIILASCSYDKRIILWNENNGVWEKTFEYNEHESSVNSLCWAPYEYGPILACGSSDGSVSILCSSSDGKWEARKIHNAHTIGCNAVSWEPLGADKVNVISVSGSIARSSARVPLKRFVTGGCDNLVKIWKYVEKEDTWCEEEKLERHSNWVRDVAWAPSIKPDRSVIASSSQDKHVIIWTKIKDKDWIPKILHIFDDVVWHVSWSVTGSVLAVSGGDNKVSLWRAVNDHQWVRLNDVENVPEENH